MTNSSISAVRRIKRILSTTFFLCFIFLNSAFSQSLEKYSKDYEKIKFYITTENVKKFNKSYSKLKEKLGLAEDNQLYLAIDVLASSYPDLSNPDLNDRIDYFFRLGQFREETADISFLDNYIESIVYDGLANALNTSDISEIVVNSEVILTIKRLWMILEEDFEKTSSLDYLITKNLRSEIESYLNRLQLSPDALCLLSEHDNQNLIQKTIDNTINRDVNEAKILCECDLENISLARLCNYINILTDNKESPNDVLMAAEYLNGFNYEFKSFEHKAIFNSVRKGALHHQRKYIESEFPSSSMTLKMKEHHDSIILMNIHSNSLNDLVASYQDVYKNNSKVVIKNTISQKVNEVEMTPYNYKIMELQLMELAKVLELESGHFKKDFSIQGSNKSVKVEEIFTPRIGSPTYYLGDYGIRQEDNNLIFSLDYKDEFVLQNLFELAPEDCYECPYSEIKPILLRNDSIVYFEIKTYYYEAGSSSYFYVLNIKNKQITETKSNLLLTNIYTGEKGFQDFALNEDGYLISLTSQDTLIIETNILLKSNYWYDVDYITKSRPIIVGSEYVYDFPDWSLSKEYYALITNYENSRLSINGDPFYFDTEYVDIYSRVMSTELWPSYLSYGDDYVTRQNNEVERFRYQDWNDKLYFNSRCITEKNDNLFLYHPSWIESDKYECDDSKDLRNGLLKYRTIITKGALSHYPSVYRSKYKNFLVPYKSIDDVYQLPKERDYYSPFKTENSPNSYLLAEYFRVMKSCDYRNRIKEVYSQSVSDMNGDVEGLINLDYQGNLIKIPSIEINNTAKLLYDYCRPYPDYSKLDPLAKFDCTLNFALDGYEARNEAALIKVDVVLNDRDEFYLSNKIKAIKVGSKYGATDLSPIELNNSGFSFLYKVKVPPSEVVNLKERMENLSNVTSIIELTINSGTTIFSWNSVL